MQKLIIILWLVFYLTVLAATYANKNEVLTRVFGTDAKIEQREIEITKEKKEKIEEKLNYKLKKTNYTFYIGSKAGRIEGYGVVLVEKGKHGPITFLIIINPEGEIREIVVLELREIKGAGIRKKRFLRQFIGKNSKDPIELKRDINAVTGATVSSKAATRAAKKALMIWEKAFGKEN